MNTEKINEIAERQTNERVAVLVGYWKNTTLQRGLKGDGTLDEAALRVEMQIACKQSVTEALADSEKEKAVLRQALTNLKTACVEIYFPMLNKSGKIEMWMPESMQHSEAMALTDAALSSTTPSKYVVIERGELLKAVPCTCKHDDLEATTSGMLRKCYRCQLLTQTEQEGGK